MSDPAIIEAAARALEGWSPSYHQAMARAVLTAVTPLIRAAALEEAALVAEAERSKSGTVEGRVVALFIEQQIRALKDQPGE